MTTTARTLLSEKPNHPIYSVNPGQSTYEALQLMAAKEVGAVAVMEHNRPVGILTERDYARKIVLHGKTSRHTPVAETMNRNFPQVKPEATLEECMRLISDSRFRYLAVMEGERLIGLVSIGDVVKHIIAHQQASIEHLERYISGI